MKANNIYSYLAAGLLCCAATACDGQKDLIIIEGNLPIKTSTLYMVGDATPNGWSIDSPTPFEATEEDPLVFAWTGTLNTGEMKLCLTTGSWDAAFIRPAENGQEIGTEPIDDQPFQMHAGNPDEKWRVVEAGRYTLTFNLREWTMSSLYLGGKDPVQVVPIESDALYIVGDATPTGWSIDAPTALEKSAPYVFEYEGPLTAGEFKACVATGSWDASFIRPSANGVELGKDGFAADDFVFTTGPDDKWKVTEAGIYHLTFDLEHWTVAGEYKGAYEPAKDPIVTTTVFMIGDATPGGWSMDNAQEFTADAANSYLFSWTGELVDGRFKACIERKSDFSCPFIRPESADVEVSSAGVAAAGFVFTMSPDDQWKVTEPGNYTVTFDLEHYTIAVKWNGGTEPGPGPEPNAPIVTETLYMIGDATPSGWSMDNATALTKDGANPYLFTYEGELKAGNLKLCLQPDGTFSCPFIRPASAGVKIGKDGVEAPDFVYTTDPDDQWTVVDAGRYVLSFDLEHYTISARWLGGDEPGPVDPDDPAGPVQPDAILSETLYMIGDATPNGWSMDDATAFTRQADSKYLFTWTGKLNTGEMKACLQPDGTFSCPFVRPASANVEINVSGVADGKFVYTTDPDDKWRVTKAGNYTITFNLNLHTIEVKYLD